MLIVNADDWGRCAAETDAALKCFKAGRVTSVSAMVFMADSERAAALARQNDVDVGLHINFAEQFTAAGSLPELLKSQARLIRYLMRSKYAQLVYNPLLSRHFRASFSAQLNEFHRLYDRPPSHFDGHHHMHLCGNVVFSNLLPRGAKMRRNFSFWPGEKSAANRAYRACIDWCLARTHRIPDYFFDLTQCIQQQKLQRAIALAETANVEMMTHPVNSGECECLLGPEFGALISKHPKGSYALL